MGVVAKELVQTKEWQNEVPCVGVCYEFVGESRTLFEYGQDFHGLISFETEYCYIGGGSPRMKSCLFGSRYKKKRRNQYKL